MKLPIIQTTSDVGVSLKKFSTIFPTYLSKLAWPRIPAVFIDPKLMQ